MQTLGTILVTVLDNVHWHVSWGSTGQYFRPKLYPPNHSFVATCTTVPNIP